MPYIAFVVVSNVGMIISIEYLGKGETMFLANDTIISEEEVSIVYNWLFFKGVRVKVTEDVSYFPLQMNKVFEQTASLTDEPIKTMF